MTSRGHRLHEQATAPRQRMLLALLLGFSAFVLLPLLSRAVLGLTWLLRGMPSWSQHLADSSAYRLVDGVAASHLALAALIPVSLLALRWGGGLSAARVISVRPGMRWRYMLVVAASTAAVLTVVVLARNGTEGVMPQPGFWVFAAVIALTAPWQAAAEEFFFRGLLLTGITRLSGSTWVGVLGSAAIFALLHGGQSWTLGAARFAFGLVAALLVIRTGGLEAAIAIHAINNLWVYWAAGLWGTIADARALSHIDPRDAVVDVAVFAVVALVAWGWWRLWGLKDRTSNELALEPSVR